MLPALAGIASLFVRKAAEIIEKRVEDKDKANELVAELQRELLLSLDRELEMQAKVVLAEAQGESWLQRNWRPILMLTIVAIVANNYLIVPWLRLIFDQAPVLALPERLWDLMTLGVGGYIVGRSGEKIAKVLRKGGLAE